MTIDERVRDALHAYADPIEPTPGSWDRIEARLDDRLPRERRSRTPFVLAAVGILVIVGLIAAAVVRDLNDDSSKVISDPGVGAPMPGRIVAVTDSGRVVVLDSAIGKVLDERAVARTSSGEQVVVSADGRDLYFGPRGFDRSCADRSLSKLTLDGPVRSVDPVAARAMSPAPSPDGRYLAFLRCSPSSTRPDEIVLRDLMTDRDRVTSAPEGTRLSGQLSFELDSRHVLVGVGTGLHRLDLVGGEALPGADLGIASWVIPRGLRDDQFLAFKGAPGTVIAIDGPKPFTADRLLRLPEASKQLAVDASGDHVLASTVDGALYRWSTGDGAPTKVADRIATAAWIPGPTPPEPDPGPKPTASPPQRVLVFGKTARGGPSMVVLPSASRGGIGEMQGVSNVVAGSPVAVTADGRVAYVVRKSVNSTCGGGDAIFRQPIASGVRDGEEITNATAPAISPDGKYLAYLRCSGATDTATIVLRNLETGSERETPGLFSFTTRLLAFSPDSRHVLVEGRADSSGPVQPRELDLVGGEQEPGRAIPAAAGVDVAAYWGEDSLVAIDDHASPQSVVPVSPTSGEVRETLFGADALRGSITDIVPNATGTAMLVVVDNSRLYWWAPGMSAPSTLDQAMLTAAWMPDEPTSTTPATEQQPARPTDLLVATTSGELLVLDTGGATEAQLGTFPGITAVSASYAGVAGTHQVAIADRSVEGSCGNLERQDVRQIWLARSPDPSQLPFVKLSDAKYVGGAQWPAVSPDGRWIAFGIRCDGVTLGLTSVQSGQNYRNDPLGARSGVRARDVLAVRPITWSPDSKRLLLTVLRRGQTFARYYVGRYQPGGKAETAQVREIASGRDLSAITFLDEDHLIGATRDGDRVVSFTSAKGLGSATELFRTGAMVTRLAVDRGGREFLAVTVDGQLLRWSKGAAAPIKISDGVVDAAWLESPPPGASSGLAGRVERAGASEGG
jgi:Tol biopolymer transport system component